MKFHENRSSGSRGDTRGHTETDRHDEANRNFSRLHANAPKKKSYVTIQTNSKQAYSQYSIISKTELLTETRPMR